MIIRKKYLFYALAFASSIIAASVSAIDATISQIYIPNPWAFSFSCFIVGIIISLLIVLVFSIPVKGRSLGSRVIDPSFKRLRLVRKEELKYHIPAAVGNAILTIGYLSLLSILGDPSTVLPFSQIVILYLILIESITEKNMPTLSEIQSSIIVTFGAILGSISLTGTINLASLAIVFLVVNPAWVLFSINQRKLKILKVDNRPNDALNIRFWNVVFACLFTAILAIIYDFIVGGNNFIEGIAASINHFSWVALTMGVTFFSYVFYIRALGIGKASVTQAVRASTVLFAIPFSILISYFNVIPPFTTDPVMILIKIIGTILVILGIVSFALALVKAYVFINIKPGYSIEETMDKLWTIWGVTRVTAIAGKYDFIVKIRTRTLVKGYEQIIQKLEEIDAIKDYKWQSVLKEWEKI
ncbi:MAG: Lrp/AsnC ligand binding domain-containing protein [Thermoplasmatales archaeon]|nr:MAG: Lrp/AsnC ligand binding domain-containing protein [Thermoplasmatales archaeon]